MHTINKSIFPIALACMFLVVGCSSITESSTGANGSGISGRVSAGPVSGSIVTAALLKADGTTGDTLATTTTDANGNYNLDITPQSSPIVITAVGGVYNEEASGLPVKAGTMSTLLSSTKAGQEIGVTPVTTIAQQSALANVDPSADLTALGTLIDSNNATVAASFGITDVTIAPADPTEKVDAAKSKDAAIYALTLATISQLASANGINSQDMMASMGNTLANNGSFSCPKAKLAMAGKLAPLAKAAPMAEAIKPLAMAAPMKKGLKNDLCSILGGTTFTDAMTSATNDYKNSAAGIAVGFNDPSKIAQPAFADAPSIPSGLSGGSYLVGSAPKAPAPDQPVLIKK